MSVQLPLADNHTSYNYEVGAERLSWVKEGKIKFTEWLVLSCPGMPCIINFNDQLAYMQKHPTRALTKLQVYKEDKILTEVALISKNKTKEFAQKSIAQWGPVQAEKVLSATESGSLYWNILHHYQSYDNIVQELSINRHQA